MKEWKKLILFPKRTYEVRTSYRHHYKLQERTTGIVYAYNNIQEVNLSYIRENIEKEDYIYLSTQASRMVGKLFVEAAIPRTATRQVASLQEQK